MSDAELEWLASHAANRRLVVELGAWCGRSSMALSSATSVLCVDTWRGSKETASELAGGFDPWLEWRRNTALYQNITPVRCDLASETDKSFLSRLTQSMGGADMVFVDAAHDYESVLRDIGTARHLIGKGGLLCGHDFSGAWPGVVAAVRELIPDVQVAAETIWWSIA